MTFVYIRQVPWRLKTYVAFSDKTQAYAFENI